MIETNTVGNNARRLRQQKGWTQGEVAKRLNISTPAYSKIETGNTDINTSRLNEIAGLFQVHVLEILPVDCDISGYLYNAELKQCSTELLEARRELISLQGKLIKVYEENRNLVERLKIYNLHLNPVSFCSITNS
jgi:transcriptional regulator with XRE-family HTH domain